MSAFQDFGPLSERRRAEKQQKQRKRLMIAGASVSVVLILAVVAVATSLYNSKGVGSDDRPSLPKQLHSSAKFIKAMCSATDFKETCESSLSNALSGAETSSPKEIVRAAVSVIAGAAQRGFNHSERFVNSENPRVKSAIALCKSLFEQAYDELKMAVSRID
ncbi:pectinesterase 1-like [Phalaenopsis equestris]|uniref:pectinesterase 1-like n=1 Tax=Phalaenopsis equestris TaxID=78828 RepID=UPI0009E41238|nr:pectinesterase 1-like [Phalaenopsis equestris]